MLACFEEHCWLYCTHLQLGNNTVIDYCRFIQALSSLGSSITMWCTVMRTIHWPTSWCVWVVFHHVTPLSADQHPTVISMSISHGHTLCTSSTNTLQSFLSLLAGHSHARVCGGRYTSTMLVPSKQRAIRADSTCAWKLQMVLKLRVLIRHLIQWTI